MSRESKIKTIGYSLIAILFCLGGLSRVVYITTRAKWADALSPVMFGFVLLAYIGMHIASMHPISERRFREKVLISFVRLLVVSGILVWALILFWTGIRIYWR